MMRVALLFPPGTDPRSPHLAFPYLAAVLRGAGVTTDMYDLDIDGVVGLLEPELIEAAGRKVRDLGVSGDARLAHLASVLPERAPLALEVFRDPAQFYDPNRFNAARETIYDCLDLHSVATGGVGYNISPIRFDVDGVDQQKLDDLIRVTADDRVNLWAHLWERDVYGRLEDPRPDLVGITITNRQQVVPGLILARRLRERGHFVVLGGTVYTKFVRELSQRPAFLEHFADAIVVYEGETALLELVHQVANGRDFSKVPNLLWLEGGRVRVGPTHLEDVDALPTPDFEGLPLERYLTPAPVLPILFGKGCYFNRCKFCDIPYINHLSKKAYRIRSPERVAGDVLELHRRFGCRHFELTDEALAPKLLEELADALEPHRDKQIRFVGYARLEPTFTPEFCRKMARMGMKKIFFGLESGAQETLDHMDKGIRVDDVPGILANCRDAGIRFHLFSIIGFPEETEESARKTYRFFEDHADLIDHPGNSFDIHPFGLELRTSYFTEAGGMGCEIPREVLDKDFVIGVGLNWRNGRQGMAPADVDRLLAGFHPGLRRRFRAHHAAPQHLWPAFEEFAVLYCDRYDEAEFPYRTSLPADSDPRPYRLRWNPAVLVVPPNGVEAIQVVSRFGCIQISPPVFSLLAEERYRPVRELLDEFVAREPTGPTEETRAKVRETIDGLIEMSLLQLQPLVEE